MTGTLELLCGPSGVGKSSSFGEKTKAYTYTTRDKRKKEVEGVDRRFIDDQTFEKLKEQGEIVVDYEFDGHRYGFSRELIAELQAGRNITEQIGPYDAVRKIVGFFEQYGTIEKTLFVCNLEDIRLRLEEDREKYETESRFVLAKSTLDQYLMNMGDFDRAVFNYPVRLAKKYASLLDSTRDSENHRTINHTFVNQISAEMENSIKYLPYLINHIVDIAELMPGLDDTKNVDFYAEFDGDTFSQLYGFTSVMLELGRYDEARAFMDKAVRELLEENYKNAFNSSNPVIRDTAQRIDLALKIQEEISLKPRGINYVGPSLKEKTEAVFRSAHAFTLVDSLLKLTYYYDFFFNKTEEKKTEDMGVVFEINSLNNMMIAKMMEVYAPVFDCMPTHPRIKKNALENMRDTIRQLYEDSVHTVWQISQKGSLSKKGEDLPKEYSHTILLEHSKMAENQNHFLWAFAARDAPRNEQTVYVLSSIGLILYPYITQNNTQISRYMAYNFSLLTQRMALAASADHSQPASFTNLLAYPFVGDYREFFRQYFRKTIPSREESINTLAENYNKLGEYLKK